MIKFMVKCIPKYDDCHDIVWQATCPPRERHARNICWFDLSDHHGDHLIGDHDDDFIDDDDDDLIHDCDDLYIVGLCLPVCHKRLEYEQTRRLYKATPEVSVSAVMTMMMVMMMMMTMMMTMMNWWWRRWCWGELLQSCPDPNLPARWSKSGEWPHYIANYIRWSSWFWSWSKSWSHGW